MSFKIFFWVSQMDRFLPSFTEFIEFERVSMDQITEQSKNQFKPVKCPNHWIFSWTTKAGFNNYAQRHRIIYPKNQNINQQTTRLQIGTNFLSLDWNDSGLS